ncbi:hypothetical protein AB1Y20_013228 [Prymnesium parvum]|uniref:Integrase catalytic domain-containing protein n=1 Tax=Prymnesium parvum TaxID=97485 RepID=A0AB34IL33_PRYPA
MPKYHCRQGHFGVHKTFGLISSRYFWKSERALRDELSTFVKHCTVCSRIKIPRHKAGAAGALPTGEWPFDVTSADAYKTGWPAPDGSEDILSFACHLTRAIIAEATRTAPTAEIVADLLLRLVIRYFGCPRILFSDSGSVFVAEANRYLYKRSAPSLCRGGQTLSSFP